VVGTGLRTTSNGYYHLVHVASGKCLNVQGGSTKPSAHVILWPCASGNDEWLPMYTGTFDNFDFYLLKNRHSGLCMNVQGGGHTNGLAIIQYACSSNYDNEWFTWEAAN
jgi:hypothetical protein